MLVLVVVDEGCGVYCDDMNVVLLLSVVGGLVEGEVVVVGVVGIDVGVIV